MAFLRKIILPILLLFVLMTGLQAQMVNFEKQEILMQFFKDKSGFKPFQHKDFYFLELCFEQNRLPNEIQNNLLKENGIYLLKYNGNYCYSAKISTGTKFKGTNDLGIVGFAFPDPKRKISDHLSFEIEHNARLEKDRVEIAVVGYDYKNLDWVAELQQELGFELASPVVKGNSFFETTVMRHQIDEIAAKPFVSYIDIAQEEEQPLNFETNGVQRNNVLHSGIPGARNLQGEGIVIGVGDGGELGEHLDFFGRSINYADGTYQAFGAHGDHVAGIACGGGIVNPRHKGAAPKADVIINKTSFIIQYIDDYYNNHELVLTNNSYGVSFNCASNGEYNYTSASMDIHMREYPKVLHCFAAGNSGKSTCDPYPKGYRTVLKFYQAAKNVLVIGNVGDDRVIADASSRGPVFDGRIKPELCGVGREVISTGRNYDYFSNGGTSMATPSVMGTLALLNQRYRQLHNGEIPDGALMKAVACNTAEDLGNEHPDYIYGYGLLNARRAAELLENNWIIYDSLGQSDNNLHTIAVPEGVSQLKVMLYWHDKEGVSGANKALVNDLDLSVENPEGNSFLPWILNPAVEHVEDVATRGVDTLNNIEQVTINSPASGDYSVRVLGDEVPFGPQKYYLVYYFEMPEIVVTFPMGDEHLVPGETEKILWDTDYNNTSTFSLDYSVNGGSSWSNIATGVAANERGFEWVVPALYTETALLKVTKETDGIEDTSDAHFRIMTAPANMTVDAICDGYLELNWDGVDYTNQYELYQFDAGEMVPLTSTDATHFIFEQPDVSDEKNWFAVAAIGTAGGRTNRTVASSGIPLNIGTCPWTNDLKLQKLTTAPIIGRARTSSALSNHEVVSICIKNVGSNTVDNAMIFIETTSGDTISQSYDGMISTGDSVYINLSEVFDFSAPGVHAINGWIEVNEDTHLVNNAVSGLVKALQLPNDPITLPYEETFAISDAYYVESTMGLKNLDKWDFSNGGNGEVLLSEADGTITIQGAEALSNSDKNDLIATLNLSNYQSVSALNLKFDYRAEAPQTNSKVYVRGRDTDSWIEVFTINIGTDWATSGFLNLATILSDNGQAFSSSTQLRFSHEGTYGYIIDNLRLSRGVSLPVAFLSFNAFKNANDALLEWKTTYDPKNFIFEVEVAENDDALMAGRFRKLGKVEPRQGASQFYQYWDKEPWKYGTRYYRIRQLDIDGTVTYSTIRSLEFDVLGEVILLSANPFQDNIRFMLDNPEARSLKIELTDIYGRTIREFNPHVEAGKREVNLVVDSEIPAGVYNLVFYLEQGVVAVSMVKQE